MILRLQPPDDEHTFEKLSCDLWNRIFDNNSFQLVGRRGQNQDGVDVIGRDKSNNFIGIQCKCKGIGKKLTEKEIMDEVEKTKKFEPSLEEYYILTTAEKDGKIEKLAREITDQHLKQDLFKVFIWGWGDIQLKIQGYRNLMEKYGYTFRTPESMINPDESNSQWILSLKDIPSWSVFVMPKVIGIEEDSKEEKTEPIKFEELFEKSENRRFVLLGRPGAGKSTLLKYLKNSNEKKMMENLQGIKESHGFLFPILVEIRNFDYELSKNIRPDYNLLNYLYELMTHQFPPTQTWESFKTYLDSGKVLLMFDGLDEVVDEERRPEILQMITTFVNNHNSGNAVIVTSRNTGYSRVNLSTTNYQHFELEGFNEKEIEEFIEKWHESREVNAHYKVQEFIDVIKKNPHIQKLAENPLLLTLIAITRIRWPAWPKDRLTLYDNATIVLLATWDCNKEIIDKNFALEDKSHFLEEVAFHLQQQGKAPGTVFEENDLNKIFSLDRNDTKLGGKFADKIRLLDIIRNRSGLLERNEKWQYFFVHKSFQEYFAAKYITNETASKNDLKFMIDYLVRFIDNTSWHETLLFALSALPGIQPKTVLDFILVRDKKGIEKYFYHNHYFVMKFIAEQGRCLGDAEFVGKQIDDFFKFSWNYGKVRSYKSNKTWERFIDWTSTVMDYTSGKILSEKLISLTEDDKQDGTLRRNCANAVGNLVVKDRTVVERLLCLAEDGKQESYLRRDCANALGKLGLKDEALLNRLLCLAKDDKQEIALRGYCAYSLGKLGWKKEAGEIISLQAKDDKHEIKMRLEASGALKKLELIEEAVEIYLLLAEDDKQQLTDRRDWIEHVGNSNLKNNAVKSRLIRMAWDNEQESSIRCYCAEALGKLGEKDKAVQILLRMVEDEKQRGSLRGYCAKALGELGEKDKAVEILLCMAGDEKQESSIRSDCAKVLGKLEEKDKSVKILLRIAEDEKQDVSLRKDCAEALGELGKKDNAVRILLSLAEDEKKGGSLRGNCAKTLVKLGEKNKAAEILLLLAENDRQDISLRRDCAVALGELGEKDKAVKILLRLAEDEEQEVSLRRDCTVSLGK